MKSINYSLTILFILSFISPLVSHAQLTELEERSSFYLGKNRAIIVSIPILFTKSPNLFSDKNEVSGRRINAFPKISFNKAWNDDRSYQWTYSRNLAFRQTEDLTERSTDWKTVWSGEVGTPKYIRNSVGFTINKHFANRGNFAPIGNFFKYGARVHMVNPDLSDVRLAAKTRTSEDLSIQDKEENYLYFTIDLGYTYRTMISSRMFFDMTVNASLPLHTKKNPYNPDLNEEQLKHDLFELTKERFQYADVGGLSFGLGLVLKK